MAIEGSFDDEKQQIQQPQQHQTYPPLPPQQQPVLQMQQQQQQQMQQVQILAQPTYTVMPNGQVQVTMMLPAGTQIPQSYGSASVAPPQYVQQRPPYYSYPQPPSYQSTYSVPPQYPYLHPQPLQSSAPLLGHPQRSVDNLAVSNLVTFIVGIFTFLPYLASLIISFVMIKKGYFCTSGRKALIITFTVMELLAWLFCASFSWFVVPDCSWYYGGYDYYYQSCHDDYFGWIAIVVWGGLAFTLGIARQIITWKAAKQFQQARYCHMPM